MSEALLRGLALEPGHPLAAPLVARLVTLARDDNEARTLMAALYQAQPEHPAVIDVQGQWALRQGQSDQALAVYREALRRFPNNNLWPLRLAETQWKAGDREGHVATLTAWLQDHPQDVKVQFVLANSYLALERYTLARQSFASVVELAPNSAQALNNLAWLLREDDPKLARTYAERALALLPDPDVMDTLGDILIRTGEPERAAEILRKAVELQPAPGIRYHLALALARSGKKAEARELLKQLLAPTDTFAERRKAEALLKDVSG